MQQIGGHPKQPSTLIPLMILLFTAKAASPQTIRVGPNVLVSRDGPNPKAELVIAASPKNPLNLIGAAIVSGFGAPDTCKTYSSWDGGYTWADRGFPELSIGANDPQVVFTSDGSTFFATTSFVYENGGKRSVIKAFHSRNGGLDWTSFTEIAKGLSPDHPQITASSSDSAVYMTVVYYPQVLAVLFRRRSPIKLLIRIVPLLLSSPACSSQK